MIRWITSYVKITFLFHYIKKQELRIRELKRWKRAFLRLLCDIRKENSDYKGCWDIIVGFAKSDIKILKKAERGKKKEDPILICVLLNEIERIEFFLEHYRRIGFRRFAIIDNGSKDGTVEYLKGQPDVELFQTKDKFETKTKIGWINRIISYYGTQHWYLVADADELLVWQGVEKGNIQNIIKELNHKKMMRVRALMVDMYSKEKTWDTSESFDEIIPKCKYFDYNTYYHRKSDELYLLYGGPRKRVLGRDVWLTKYPLFKFDKNELLINPHAIYPYNNEKIPCYFAILHYKFLTQNDKKKMRKYAREESYACKSAEYKAYMSKQRENKDNFQFYFDESVEYQSSQSLAKIKEIDIM